MVIQRSAVSLQDGLSPIKQSQSSLGHDLGARAVTALDEAREMPPGDERTEAITKQSSFEMPPKFTNCSAASAAHRPYDGAAFSVGRDFICDC